MSNLTMVELNLGLVFASLMLVSNDLYTTSMEAAVVEFLNNTGAKAMVILYTGNKTKFQEYESYLVDPNTTGRLCLHEPREKLCIRVTPMCIMLAHARQVFIMRAFRCRTVKALTNNSGVCERSLRQENAYSDTRSEELGEAATSELDRKSCIQCKVLRRLACLASKGLCFPGA